MDFNEEASISLRVEGKEFTNELDRLETKAKELVTQLKEVEKTVGKGSDEWKAVKLESKAATDAVNEHRKSVDNTQLTYGQLQNQVKKLDSEVRKLKPGTDEWVAAVKKADDARKILEKVNTEIGEIKKANENAEKAALKMASNSGLTYNDLKKKVELLRTELGTLAPKSNEFVTATKKLAETEKYLNGVEQDIKAVNDELNRPEKMGLWAKIKAGFGAVGDSMKQAFGVVSLLNIQAIVQAVINFGREAILKAAEVSDAFGDIRKATGQTTQEILGMNAEIRKIDTRTAQKDLLEIAKVGGQINIAKEQMLGFVESVDKAVVALGDEFTGGADEVATKMGVLSKLFKETKDLNAGKAINDIGSAINDLGAAGSATGPVIAEFSTRLGQLGKLAPAIDKTLGLGAALQELGLTAEIAAGGLSNILLGAAKATELYAKQIGLTEKEFKKLIDSDPNEVILRLAKSFKGLPIDVVIKQMDDLGIKSQEASKVMMLLSDKTEMVKDKQIIAAKAMKEGTSLTNEFAIKNNTAGAELAKAGKKVDELRDRIGMFLIPVVLAVTTGFIGLINTLIAIPQFVIENKEAFVALGVAIVSLNTANIAAASSALYHAAVEKSRAVVTKSVTAAQWLLNAAMTANPIGLVIAGVALLVGGFVTLYNHSVQVRAGVAALWEGLKATGTVIAQFGKALVSMDFAGMAKALSEGGKTIGDAFMKGYQNKLDSESPKVISKHKNTVDSKVKTTTQGAEAAANAEIMAAAGATDAISKSQEKASEKRKKAKEKELEEYQKAEEKYDKQVQSDREKALELLAQMESEHDQAVATTSLAVEESKINAKRSKRLREMESSKVDEKTKADAIEAINRTAESQLEKVREEYRIKRVKADEEAAKKRLESENFIREQERQAEMVVFDFREQQAKGNAQKLASIRKERLDTELRLTQEKLAAEMVAEQKKATDLITNDQQLADSLKQIEDRFNTASVLATAKTADEKKQIDDDLRKRKEDNLRAYSDMFGSLLKGDVSGFMAAAGSMVKGHQEAWQKKLSADMASYQMGADMAQQAVSFLNDLAQKKADRAIALANKERDEKVAILTNELAVTDSLITSSSNYVQALKTAETNRLTELQQILTAETSTEEQKRDALKKYYSEQLQQMKAAEEAKIQDLQRLANLAKTDDEKRAIEEKIRMAKEETATKIRLAEEEATAKAAEIDALAEFTAETNAAVLKDAQAASDKQIEISEKEVTTKAEFKEDLEGIIAAENRKARATEAAEKKKAWQAQKKADIASALVTGALAILKALANFFPLNIVLAAVAAVTTGVQIAKIKSQPEPQFSRGAYGYFSGAGYLKGGKHGAKYGDGGIAFVDRRTGNEVGEAEDGEAYIMSNEITKRHKPILDQIIYQSVNRQPGPLKLNGASTMMRNGSMMNSDGGSYSHYVPTTPYWEKNMMLFGSKKRKAEQAAKDAEAEAAAAQAEADQAMADSGVDMSAYGGVNGSDPSATGDTASAQAAHAKAEKQGEETLKTQKDILAATEGNGDKLDQLILLTVGTKGAVNNLEGAVNGVRDAVNNSNQSGRMDALIGAVSLMGKK